MKLLLTTLLCLICTTVLADGLESKISQVDFGKISQTTSRNLTLYNRSKTPVVIVAAEVSCNCTKIDYSTRPIKAGDSMVVKITYIPKDKGAFYKTVQLKNSAGKPFQFVVRGSVL